MVDEVIKQKAKKIKLLLTDNDGVLTDGGVYYSGNGEEFKRYNIRDGMGVERLRNIINVETGIITGELSLSLKKRAEKLNISELHLGIKDKSSLLLEILLRKKLSSDQVAYIGDDVNDLEIMKVVGLSASPADGISFAKNQADYICENKGGNGAFREFAELIIESKLENKLM